MNFPKLQNLLLRSLSICLLTLLLSGCSIYRNDRMWISDDQYQVAQAIYDKSGSLELTREELKKIYWRHAEINEAVYRLKKLYHLEQSTDGSAE